MSTERSGIDGDEGSAGKPAIEELEAILAGAPGSIEIQPDGSVKTVDGEPIHAKPEILTLRQALGGTY